MASLKRHHRPDGTFLIYYEGDNMHLNHWHIAPDGTVLSVKEGGNHKYKRTDVRKNIGQVLGRDWLSIEWVPDND